MELLKEYREKIIPDLKKELGVKSSMAVPRLQKIIINVGVGRMVRDEKNVEQVVSDLALITGQKPVPTTAKKAIASFKTRIGMVLGYKITLRGKRMYDFLERLLKIALPRTRDFRGISTDSISGNSLTIGIKEHIVFPELSTENVKNIFGFEITLVSNAKTGKQSFALFRSLGVPFKK